MVEIVASEGNVFGPTEEVGMASVFGCVALSSVDSIPCTWSGTDGVAGCPVSCCTL